MILWILCLLPFGIAWPFESVTARSPAELLSSTPPNVNSTILSNTTSLPTLEPIQYVQTESLLNIAYYDDGPTEAPVVILIHGFPYDINAYVDVAPQLVQKGYRVIVPYLRGFGTTTFLNQSTPRSSEQAAIGYDIIALMDALNIQKAIFAGYDWGTVAVNVAAALWPERCTGMVAANSYLIQNRSTAWVPSSPDSEATKWYYYLFLTPRGFAALAQDPVGWARVLWAKNSPQWNFSDAELERTAPALYNPDFTTISVNFYRIRLLYAPGDPAYAQLADVLDSQPPISVPSVTLDPEFSVVFPPTNGSSTAKYFTGPRVHHIVPNTGENIPQQNPTAFVNAVIEVAGL
jgi:pimeloyl-ACP methyl ester carboxylesterase